VSFNGVRDALRQTRDSLKQVLEEERKKLSKLASARDSLRR
jgi:hypothetical protein